MNMRLDHTLYVLAALLFIITVVPFVVTIEGVESETRNLWVVTTFVLGLLSIGLGYSQRPKTKAQACQPTTMEAPKEEKTEVPIEKTSMKETSAIATPAVTPMDLTQVKGIGEKRAMQLKALGITSIDELANASAKNIAKKLKVSPKTVDRWIEGAKELGK